MGANLAGADCQHTDFSGADLTNANLGGAKFTHVTLNDATLPDGSTYNEESNLAQFGVILQED